MQPKTVLRVAPVLVFIGYALWLPAVLALVLATMYGVISLIMAGAEIMAGAGGVTGDAALNSETGFIAAGFADLTAIFGWRFVIVTLVAAIPALIIGLQLTRRRSVWRCSQCGYAYDRI